MEKLENLFYEAKPIFYCTFAVIILRSGHIDSLWVKRVAAGIFLFGAYIFYLRLVHRGYVK